jgi:hypothetical protein
MMLDRCEGCVIPIVDDVGASQGRDGSKQQQRDCSHDNCDELDQARRTKLRSTSAILMPGDHENMGDRTGDAIAGFMHEPRSVSECRGTGGRFRVVR